MTKPAMNTKVKIEIGALATLLFSAIGVWYYFGHPAVGSARAASRAISRYKPMGVENPQIHWNRLDEAQQTKYESTGRDIFTGGTPPPPPPPVVIPEPVDHEIAPPPPPPPPQLPLKYFGYGAAQADSRGRAFLTDGAAVYIVAEGDTILGQYRVIRITRANLEFEEISTSRRGVAIIEDQGPSF
jgi:hypothetical protein